MGLDMYAYRVNAGILSPDDRVDFTDKLLADGGFIAGVDREFAYWRKFNALHGWMENLYRSKGGARDFNNDPVRLMPEDIDELEYRALTKSLVPVDGFFFGDSTTPFSDEDQEEVLEFVMKAKVALAAGDAVVYDSWW